MEDFKPAHVAGTILPLGRSGTRTRHRAVRFGFNCAILDNGVRISGSKTLEITIYARLFFFLHSRVLPKVSLIIFQKGLTVPGVFAGLFPVLASGMDSFDRNEFARFVSWYFITCNAGAVGLVSENIHTLSVFLSKVVYDVKEGKPTVSGGFARGMSVASVVASMSKRPRSGGRRRELETR